MLKIADFEAATRDRVSTIVLCHALPQIWIDEVNVEFFFSFP